MVTAQTTHWTVTTESYEDEPFQSNMVRISQEDLDKLCELFALIVSKMRRDDPNATRSQRQSVRNGDLKYSRRRMTRALDILRVKVAYDMYADRVLVDAAGRMNWETGNPLSEADKPFAETCIQIMGMVSINTRRLMIEK
jgi:hypothetical protein